MLDKRLLVTGVSLLMVMAVSLSAAMLSRSDPPPPAYETPVHDVVRGRATRPPPSAPEREYLYLIREYQGRVAVFGRNPDTPEIILERFVRHLPSYDQIQLREGVKVHSVQELEARIEDYTS